MIFGKTENRIYLKFLISKKNHFFKNRLTNVSSVYTVVQLLLCAYFMQVFWAWFWARKIRNPINKTSVA
jgi:ABC-type iron transport system FetAB permease component